MTLKLWLGILLGVATVAGTVLTVFVLCAVIKLAFFKGKSPIYIISAANMMCDLIQLLLALLYLVPSIILDDWLFKGGRHNTVVELLSDTFLFCWYYGSVAQILMAINRRKQTQIRHNFRFSFDQEVLSYSYTSIEGVVNYSNSYIDLPLNTSSSAICAICYSYVSAP
ncbi:hypothetical protein GCK32_019655, partial [Trichostrongylus colubriformis]